MNERKLFFECTNGNLEKYKFCVKIETSNLHHVLIGVTSSCFQYSFYISAKNSDDSITTFFIDQNTKYQFESALASFIETGDPNKLEIYEGLHKPTMQWKTDKMCFPLEYDEVEGNLVIFQKSTYPTKIITFDKNMIYNY